jgi:hypothetical protein
MGCVWVPVAPDPNEPAVLTREDCVLGCPACEPELRVAVVGDVKSLSAWVCVLRGLCVCVWRVVFDTALRAMVSLAEGCTGQPSATVPLNRPAVPAGPCLLQEEQSSRLIQRLGGSKVAYMLVLVFGVAAIMNLEACMLVLVAEFQGVEDR